MTIDTVLSHIEFHSAVDPTSRASITQVIIDLYNGSPKMRGYLDNIGTDDSGVVDKIKFVHGDTFLTDHLNDLIFFSSLVDQNLLYKDGTVGSIDAHRAFAHELVHVLTDTLDFLPTLTNMTTPGQMYDGDTVPDENAIMDEMNAPSQRASYPSAITTAELASIGHLRNDSLTEGHAIGLGLVDKIGDVQFDAIDVADRTDNVLLVGLAGNDTIDSASGDDYLYGGVGTDILSGSGGVDKLFGNDGADTLVGGSSTDNLT